MTSQNLHLSFLTQHFVEPIVMNSKCHLYLQAWYSEECVVSALHIRSLVCIEVQLQHKIGTFDGKVIGLSLSHHKALSIDVYLWHLHTLQRGRKGEHTAFLCQFLLHCSIPTHAPCSLRSGI